MTKTNEAHRELFVKYGKFFKGVPVFNALIACVLNLEGNESS